jgi:hypothetical protein
MTKKQAITGKKVKSGQPPSATQFPAQPVAPLPTLAGLVQSVQEKFAKLKEINSRISNLHAVYQERDALLKELLPLFIEVKQDQFIIRREITIGSEKYRFTPSFYDTKKAEVLAKEWRSTAFPTGTIE